MYGCAYDWSLHTAASHDCSWVEIAFSGPGVSLRVRVRPRPGDRNLPAGHNWPHYSRIIPRACNIAMAGRHATCPIIPQICLTSQHFALSMYPHYTSWLLISTVHQLAASVRYSLVVQFAAASARTRDGPTVSHQVLMLSSQSQPDYPRSI